MKNILRQSLGALLLTGAVVSADIIFAQPVEVTKTTTTTEGTVSEFGPQSIFIKTEPGIKPIRYIFSETTNYVDEEGKPVSFNQVKSGLPVTVYYTKVGDTLIASKVVVKMAAIIPARTVETTLIPSAGTISEFGPEIIIVKTESSPAPVRYTYSKTTSYVDENGKPVPLDAVRSGLPVTVYYTKVGDSMVATKVVVSKAAFAAPPVIEEKRTTTTTTTEK